MILPRQKFSIKDNLKSIGRGALKGGLIGGASMASLGALSSKNRLGSSAILGATGGIVGATLGGLYGNNKYQSKIQEERDLCSLDKVSDFSKDPEFINIIKSKLPKEYIKLMRMKGLVYINPGDNKSVICGLDINDKHTLAKIGLQAIDESSVFLFSIGLYDTKYINYNFYKDTWETSGSGLTMVPIKNIKSYLLDRLEYIKKESSGEYKNVLKEKEKNYFLDNIEKLETKIKQTL